jgi:putative endonuclease
VSDRRRALGTVGEDAVAAWYQQAGYELLDRNWRCRDGELDLVLGRGRTIAFCEVKTRSSLAFGTPVEAITWQKRRRLRGLAARWLAEHDDRRGDVRFDVASVRLEHGRLVVQVLEAAF